MKKLNALIIGLALISAIGCGKNPCGPAPVDTSTALPTAIPTPTASTFSINSHADLTMSFGELGTWMESNLTWDAATANNGWTMPNTFKTLCDTVLSDKRADGYHGVCAHFASIWIMLAHNKKLRVGAVQSTVNNNAHWEAWYELASGEVHVTGGNAASVISFVSYEAFKAEYDATAILFAYEYNERIR